MKESIGSVFLIFTLLTVLTSCSFVSTSAPPTAILPFTSKATLSSTNTVAPIPTKKTLTTQQTGYWSFSGETQDSYTTSQASGDAEWEPYLSTNSVGGVLKTGTTTYSTYCSGDFSSSGSLNQLVPGDVINASVTVVADKEDPFNNPTGADAGGAQFTAAYDPDTVYAQIAVVMNVRYGESKSAQGSFVVPGGSAGEERALTLYCIVGTAQAKAYTQQIYTWIDAPPVAEVACTPIIQLPQGLKPGEELVPLVSFLDPEGNEAIPFHTNWVINGKQVSTIIWDGKDTKIELNYVCSNHRGGTEVIIFPAYSPGNPPQAPVDPAPQQPVQGQPAPLSSLPIKVNNPLAVVVGAAMAAVGALFGAGITTKSILDALKKGKNVPLTQKKAPKPQAKTTSTPPKTPPSPTPAQIEAIKLKVKQQAKDAYDKEGKYVSNHNMMASVWHNGIKWIIPIDRLRGNKAGTCGDWVEWGEPWAKELVKDQFPDAIVDTININEASSQRDDTNKRRGTGFADWTDAVYRDNHIANRITFPNGERYVVDYWESAATGKPEVIPEKEWIKKWEKKLAYDAVVVHSDKMDKMKEFIDKYKVSHGNTPQAEYQALQEYLRANPGNRNAEILARSWKNQPW